VDDLALLDEASYLIGGRTRTYGHVVIDEAQDLTPMQFRMVTRRIPSGSLTVLGDLAQATGPWTYSDWGDILEHLPDRGNVRREELTVGYRAPGRVLDFASQLLPLAAPAIRPTTSIRAGRTDPRIRAVTGEDLLAAGLDEALALAGDHALVALVVDPGRLDALTRLVRGRHDVGLLERDGISRPVTVLGAPDAKGLEFDAVVVLEPAAIAGDEQRGLRLLYVAMTRPIQHLSIVHAGPLPAPLRQ
jgi:DNA helicase IV